MPSNRLAPEIPIRGPAPKNSLFRSLTVVNDELKEEVKLDPLEAPETEPSKMPPDDRFGSNLLRSLTQSEFGGIQTGNASIWAYGIVEYRGIRRRIHTTRFCCIWYVQNGNSVYDPVGPEGWTEYT